MNDDELIRQAMSLLGKRTSDRKRESSRENARKPRKKSKSTLSKIQSAQKRTAKSKLTFSNPLALTVPNGEKP